MRLQSFMIHVLPSSTSPNKYDVWVGTQRHEGEERTICEPRFQENIFEAQVEIADDDLLRWETTVVRRVLRLMEARLSPGDGGWISGTGANGDRASETLTQEM